MIVYEDSAPDRENIALIYSGLGSISNKGRKYLKKIAQTLVAIQNRPGTPLPDRICREFKTKFVSDTGVRTIIQKEL